jgi:hypothetical protein
MPLQPIPTSASTTAETAAQTIVQLIEQTSARIKAMRANGLPARPVTPARPLPNGQVIPEQPAQPAVTGAEIDAKLGAQNCAILDALAAALE